MQEAWSKIHQALANAESPAVLSSFGKDSMLLLHMAREVRPDITVVWFRTGQDETFAKRVIREMQPLVVLSWKPADVYLLTGEGTTMVHEYDFGGDRLPLLIDLVNGERCSINQFADRTPQVFPPFDVLLVGWKDTDSHWVKGNGRFKEDGFMLGKARVFAPIRHLTNEQVMAAIMEMRIPYEVVEDELPVCTRCMTANANEVYCPELGRIIPRQQWLDNEQLTAFRQRNGLEGLHG